MKTPPATSINAAPTNIHEGICIKRETNEEDSGNNGSVVDVACIMWQIKELVGINKGSSGSETIGGASFLLLLLLLQRKRFGAIGAKQLV